MTKGRGDLMSAVTHRGWCNAHLDAEDGLGLCSWESEPVETFGLDVTEDDHGIGVFVWHPMRPGQNRRHFTAGEARAIAAELVRAAELVEAEEGIPKA